ncbi:leucine-rich repeat flightless-interacting protein 2-like isoform X3 [Tachysurus fulvidraco]|uniref:leucine-rich repeat flightless-interacting protein 2-like isoform X3 n=1 Tax=Tachysurus fulvidraco TaxID=1234273 RepID=UPI001FEE07AC|nr:leucine-rich repeat flightless-interacting protein 2-like isoform X3 [Tachysurus fulvidraco]XP_047660340.1 leucine-rich repeat flightless-interacting protein 2-like isoform X3 [Tachysurus fulvidraco]XP_047660341.1 leucine-rich repeat flightless-interacting protein 2-like isoform X3 [Tachysurus fulvidraco]
MRHLMTFIRSQTADLVLRPLLFAAGAAAAVTAAGVYYYINLDGDGERKAERADSPDTGDPVETLSTDTNCSLVESDLMFDVNGVRDAQTNSTVPEDSERAEEAYRILQSQYEETLKQRDGLLMVSLPEAERKYKQVMKTNAQLEKEKSKLMSRVDTLQGSMQQLGHLLCETRTECIEAKRKYEVEQKICKYVQNKLDEKKAKRKEKLVTLRESLTAVKEKYEEAMANISQMEDENSNLRSDVETLQDSVQELDRELAVSQITCKELTRECDGAKQQLRILQSECSEMKDILLKDCERVPEVHRMLMSQNEVLKKLLKQNEELMQASLDEAESKYEKTVMTNAELEKKNSDLMSLVTTLQGTVEVMEKKLAETCRKCDDIRRECEQEREAHIKQKLRCADFRKALSECSQLLKENEQELGAHNIQMSQYDQMTLTHNEKLLKKQMAEAEKRYEQEKETNAHLVKEKLDLMSQVENLKGKVEGLGELLAEKRRQCAEALLECSIAKSIQTMTKSKEETLEQEKDSIRVSLCEAETKYSEVMKTNTKLENENSTLHFTVVRLQDLVHNLKKELSETKRTCNAALRECEQEREAYSIMQSQCDQMKQTLSDQEKSHTVSLAKAVEKYNQAMESNVQLENEKSDLMYQVHKLEGTVQQLEEKLSDSAMMCGAIKQCANMLWVLKFQASLPEAEEKHEPAMESSAQLDGEKSELMSQVNSLRCLVRQLEEELSETRRNCEEITEERDRELKGS